MRHPHHQEKVWTLEEGSLHIQAQPVTGPWIQIRNPAFTVNAFKILPSNLGSGGVRGAVNVQIW